MPSIHSQVCPSHEGTCIAYQKHRRASILLRFAQLPQHILRRPISPPIGKLLEERFNHGGNDVAGRDGVDADAVGSPFRGQVACKLDDAGFGGVVGGAYEVLEERGGLAEVDELMEERVCRGRV